MALEEVGVNLSEVLEVLPASVSDPVGGLLTILKAAGIAFIIYVIYLVVRLIFDWKRFKKLRHIEKKLDRLDRRLDNFLKVTNKRKKKKKK